jgi:hypothetical protein
MARTRPSPAPPVVTFEPEDPLGRALNRIKGDGRRRIVTGLVASGVPLRRVPRLLLRENLTAFEHATIWRTGSWPLSGEWLPDLMPGEVEETRVLWLLPDDARVLSLRARPLLGGAAFRLVDDQGGVYALPRTLSPLPTTDRDVVFLLDGARSGSLPHPLGALRSCWEEARRLGLEKQRVRDAFVGRTVVTGRRLKPIVDELFEEFWSGEPGGADVGLPASEEVVQ